MQPNSGRLPNHIDASVSVTSPPSNIGWQIVKVRLNEIVRCFEIGRDSETLANFCNLVRIKRIITGSIIRCGDVCDRFDNGRKCRWNIVMFNHLVSLTIKYSKSISNCHLKAPRYEPGLPDLA